MEFKSYIYNQNHWLLEPDLRAILSSYWQDWQRHEASLVEFGALAGGRAYRIADYVDREARPSLVMHNPEGERVDRVELSPSHAQILKDLAPMNRPPYEGDPWHHHFAMGFLLADPGLYCSLIVTNQTAYVIHKYAPAQRDWLAPLLSGEKWGATWMTETQGGSDLGANTTVARQTPGGWIISGDRKYFASNAGLTDLAVVTARPEGAKPGPKGLALFLVPRMKAQGGLNYTIRRLKDKSATRAVPTGEVEFYQSQAFLVGTPEEGIYYTMEMLTVSRLANAVSAMGLARKAHLEALFRTRARHAFGHPLQDHPLIRWDLTDLAVRLAGGLALVFHAIEAFDQVWQESPPYSLQYHYARFLSHLAKNRTAEHASQATRLAMELFGGLGFLNEMPLARLHREALVTTIWEGASNIQALDMLETIHKKGAHESFLDDLVPMLENAGTDAARLALVSLRETLANLGSLSLQGAQWHSKLALTRLADAAQVGLLYRLAESGGERYARLADLYARRFIQGEPYPEWAAEDETIWSLIGG